MVHKVEVEKLCEEYSEIFGLKINIIRFFSIYGEGLKKQLLWDFSNRVMKDLGAKKIPCFGKGTEKRDFIHIQDAIKLIELLIEKDNKLDTINCASGVETSVVEILKLISNELNFTGNLVFDNIAKEGDPKILVANIDKALSIGFSPKIKVEDGIKEYIKWFRKSN